MASKLAREKVALAWCTKAIEDIEMDSRLAEAFADILEESWSESNLGNATTRELLLEITARIEMNGKLDYKTTEL